MSGVGGVEEQDSEGDRKEPGEVEGHPVLICARIFLVYKPEVQHPGTSLSQANGDIWTI